MQQSPSSEQFFNNPVGHWLVAAPTSVVFCATPELCGCTVWGRPSAQDTQRVLAAFELFRHPALAQRFDVVLDSRAIDGVDPDALGLLVEWLSDRKVELARRVRLQLGVIADTIVGITLTGILPVLGDTHAFRVVRDPREAFRALTTDGDTLCDQLEAAVAEAQGAPRELRELRELLRAASGATPIEAAARAISVSIRTLQRVLHESGTSFSQEQREARFAVARELLVSGDDKVSAVARRVGLSENALTQLVRDKTGLTAAELRKSCR